MITLKTGRLLIALAILVFVSVSTSQAQIAVVVHKDNPTNSLTSDELSRMYLGSITVFPNRVDISLFGMTPLNEQFLDQLLGMSSLKYKNHWMRLVFSGAYATPPACLANGEEMSSEMCRVKNSIGFVKIDEVSDCMKVLIIDGHRPGDNDYLFAKEADKASEED